MFKLTLLLLTVCLFISCSLFSESKIETEERPISNDTSIPEVNPPAQPGLPIAPIGPVNPLQN